MNYIKKHLKEVSPVVKLLHLIRKLKYDLNPEEYLKIHFKSRAGYELNLISPETYNEKLQWLKLYWRDPLAEKCADKYELHDFVHSRGLGEYLNEIYGVYENVDEIDLSILPSEFVLKSTHASGQVIICRDKRKIDWNKSKKRMKRWLKTNYYFHSFEWVYKNITPRIICEKLIQTDDGKPPKDYKIFCFDGVPKMIFVASDRVDGRTKFDFYSCDWELLDLKQHYPNSGKALPKPPQLEKMLEIASELSIGFPHVRIDLYVECDRILIGEMTFFHFSGNQPFEPFEYDVKLGSYINLPNSIK